MTTWIAELDARYAQEWQVAIPSPVPVPESQLVEFEALIGRRLYQPYRDFLAYAGESHGALFRYLNAETEFSRILAYYDEFTENPADYPAPPWSIMGVSEVDIDVLLNNASGEIFKGSYGDVDVYYCDSFEKLAWQSFERASLQAQPIVSRRSKAFSEVPSLMAATSANAIEAILTKLGGPLEPRLSICDRTKAFFRRGATLVGCEVAGTTLVTFAGGVDSGEVDACLSFFDIL